MNKQTKWLQLILAIVLAVSMLMMSACAKDKEDKKGDAGKSDESKVEETVQSTVSESYENLSGSLLNTIDKESFTITLGAEYSIDGEEQSITADVLYNESQGAAVILSEELVELLELGMTNVSFYCTYDDDNMFVAGYASAEDEEETFAYQIDLEQLEKAMTDIEEAFVEMLNDIYYVYIMETVDEFTQMDVEELKDELYKVVVDIVEEEGGEKLTKAEKAEIKATVGAAIDTVYEITEEDINSLIKVEVTGDETKETLNVYEIVEFVFDKFTANLIEAEAFDEETLEELQDEFETVKGEMKAYLDIDISIIIRANEEVIEYMAIEGKMSETGDYVKAYIEFKDYDTTTIELPDAAQEAIDNAEELDISSYAEAILYYIENFDSMMGLV